MAGDDASNPKNNTQKNKDEEVADDHTSPFYLHASDYPKQMHVNDLLTDKNYTDWAQEMMNFLFAKNKVGFVDGSVAKPEKESTKYMPWMRCDAMIKGWLTTAMEKEIRNSVKYAKTAREVWNDLKERFGKESAPKAYELKQSLAGTQQNGTTVSAYYTRLRSLWDEMESVLPTPRCSCDGCTCGLGKKLEQLKEKERIFEFLMGLDDQFGVIRTQILAMTPTPNLSTSYHLVAEDEQQRAITTTKRPTQEATAFQASYQGRREGSRNKQHDKGWQKNSSSDKNEHCTFCDRDGHNRDGCFKRIGYPEWWPGNGKKDKPKPKAATVEIGPCPIPGMTEEQYKSFLKLFSRNQDEPVVANMAGRINTDCEWVVDSGATEHITHQKNLLKNLTVDALERPVTIPNGEAIPVKGKGDFLLKKGLKVGGVLFVPKFTCNLLSVRRLTRDLHCAVTFFPDFFVLQGLKTGNLIGAGNCRGGLYRMGGIKEERKVMMVTADSWHKRLGHASNVKLSHVNFLNGVSLNFKNKVCDSCNKAKLTRLPFPVSFIKTSECFDLIHCDLWGKYRRTSLTGANYFLTIVDDYSRAVWIYLLKHKYEASTCLVEFYKMVKTQFGKCIKRIRCDNGGEFVSNQMNQFYAEQGIVLETTCSHTPQQNGVVERKHRHLLEIARALRFEANLPTTFWGECILTATYIVNRLPSKVINNKTPYEVLLGRDPEYDHMRVFGCLAYYRNTETNGDKFEPRGKPGVFLGYPHGKKGYKVYDLEERKMVVSRDVIFAEDVFPFAKMEQKTQSHEPEIFEHMHPITQYLDCMCHKESAENTGKGEVHVQRDENKENENSRVGPTISNTSDAHLENDVNQEPHVIGLKTNIQGVQTVSGMQDNENEVHVHDEVVNEEPPIMHKEIEEGRSKRNITMPKYLNDYQVKLPPSIDRTQPDSNQGSSTVHPLSNYVSYANFSNSHKAFLSAVNSHDVPKTFYQAAQNSNWKEAMEKEIKALEQNETWSLASLPAGKKAIDSKWVYKVKFKPNGEVERYKARLVARGFKQMEGVDYHDTFAPVAKLVTVRTLLAIAVKRGWEIQQLDVDNAFLHGDLEEEVYMKIPQGFGNKDDTRVCKLNKSIYGLKQASRNWYLKFTKSLVDLGYQQSKADHSLFIYKNDGAFVAALIYVDDVIIVGNSTKQIQQTKAHLDKEFNIKDLGSLKYFLGIEVARTSEGLVLSQRKYTLDILKDSGLQGCRPSSFPMEPNLKLDKGEEEEKVDANQYRRLIGRLLYLQATRPDIAYSVNVLSQFVGDPRRNHMDAAIRVLRYLKTTVGQGILLPKEGGVKLVTYCDSDWLGCPFSRRSRTGYLLLLGGAPISWKSKKQSVVSRSSAEAEYRAMATSVSEVLWVRWLLKELEVIPDGPTPLLCDNQAARHIANNPVFHERTKHVEMDCHFVRERVERKEIVPMHVDSKQQIADLLTKPLGSQSLRTLIDKLGIRNLHAPT
ncbi:hypothetical protein QVD17_32133 [Tagetes erecta]|uniref:Integrase catalytic domain-containing protein n=1 Tax=Tagetes erecta TaxID=13708 RepID=A0AAD8NPY4_TARER|nr:hypothetical protein QVD17_32133 [Tagetes erecta]